MLFGRHSELSLTIVRKSYLDGIRNRCSLGASFGGSFGMGRGLPNSPSAQTQQPFSCSFSHRPCSSLRKAFARNSGWIKIVSGTEKCLYVVGYDVVIPGSFGHTRLDRVSQLLWVKYRYHSLSAYCDTVSLSKIMPVLLLNSAWIGSKWINSVSLSKKMSVFLLNWTTIGVGHLGCHSELVLTNRFA